MSEADLFREYAKEAMHGSSKATSENEKRILIDRACTSCSLPDLGGGCPFDFDR